MNVGVKEEMTMGWKENQPYMVTLLAGGKAVAKDRKESERP